MLERGNIAIGTASPAALALDARWEKIKTLLQRDIGDNNYRSWIAPVAPKSFYAGILELSAPTRFVRDWVKTHYADRIRLLWAQNFGALSRIDIIVTQAAQAPPAAPEPIRPAIANDAEARDDLSSPLDPRYTFENFVAGPSNDMALAAARKVAASDAPVFNPLYICGGVGLGKTHLLQSIAAEVRARNPAAKVACMSAERFMYRFVQALRGKDTMAFKEGFRAVDVLLIDDLQFICGKEATQEEFFHTFNALLTQGRQVVVSADRNPGELQGIDERLRSRLGGGLVVQVQPAAFDLRLQILKSKCRLLKRDIPEDVLAFLASKITSNVRELEGALNRLVAHAELMNRAVNLEAAHELLQDVLRAGERRVSIEDIQKKVADYYNIRIADLHSPRRARPVARPRQVAMYICKALTERSLPDIGRSFGGRDHTTIIHGIRKIEELMLRDPKLRDDVEVLKRALAG